MNDAFVDPATRAVLGVQAFLDGLKPDSDAGARRTRTPRWFGPDDMDAWRTELERLADVDAWWARQTDDQKAVRQALCELPLLGRPSRQLRAGDVLDATDLFTVKRFLFYANEIARICVDLGQDWDGFDLCPERLTSLMGAIHPQTRPTPRFHLADELSDELAELRATLRPQKKRRRSRRRDLEAAVQADYNGTFDVHGVFRPPDGSRRSDMLADIAEDPRLRSTPAGLVLADAKLMALGEQIEALEDQLDKVDYEVRARLSRRLAGCVGWLDGVADALGRLDERLAKVRLRRRIDGCWPRRADPAPDESGMRIDGGREPGVRRDLARRGADEVQPVDVDIGQAPVVVTGPNMGGKSVLLRLIGICQWCAQHAMPVPATDYAFEAVAAVVYVGSEEPRAADASRGLSSFGREVSRLVKHRHGPAGPRLWLLDEFGRGTHPDEGAEIAGEVIAKLASKGDYVVAATHFPSVAALPMARHWRIAGLVDPGRLDDLLADADADVQAALHAVMDYRPMAHSGRSSGDDAQIPRDARLVARALGLELDNDNSGES